jgi:hypothetical protein
MELLISIKQPHVARKRRELGGARVGRAEALSAVTGRKKVLETRIWSSGRVMDNGQIGDEG